MNPLAARLLLPGLALAAIHVPLVPFSHAADRASLPDLLFCLLVAATVRRPDAVPLALVLALGLLADLLLARPPGLGALGLVFATEVVRSRRRPPFLAEILLAAALFGAIVAGSTLLLALTFAPLPGVGPLAAHWLATAIAYPLVALLLRSFPNPRPDMP